MKANADKAVEDTPSVEKIIVVRRTDSTVNMTAGRDVWWHDALAAADPTCAPEPMDAEDPLFILYTSGSTGKPKGVLHTTGGYLTYVEPRSITCSITSPVIFTGARPTSGGSLATVTSPTDPWLTALSP